VLAAVGAALLVWIASGLILRAFESGQVGVHLWNPRDFAEGNYRRVDDRPFGGGPGMVMMAEPLWQCLQAIRAARGEADDARAPVVLFSPIGDALIYGLSSGSSIRWFQRNQTYRDPDVLNEAEVTETRRIARLANAKHAQLAFVTNRLSLGLDPDEVRTLAPRVLWGSGQRFVDPTDPDRWRAAGAEVLVVPDGLPQVEDPEATRAFITAGV